MKKLTIMFLVTIMVSLLFSVDIMALNSDETWDLHCAEQFAGGDGTQENPYQISNAMELALMAKLLNMNKYTFENENNPKASAHYILTQDIDLSEYYWVPMGFYRKTMYWTNFTCPFRGTLDGNNHTISNMRIRSTALKDVDETEFMCQNIGLFAQMYGTVRNLNINNADIMIDRQSSEVGILTGEVNGIIDNCVANGVIKCEEGNTVTFAGGISGTLLDSEITRCISDVEMYLESHRWPEGSRDIGGIVGNVETMNYRLTPEQIEQGYYFIQTERNTLISDCVFVGKISGGSVNIGGIVGSGKCSPGLDGYPLNTIIKNCVNAAIIDVGENKTGENHGTCVCACIGGIAGEIMGEVLLSDNLYMGQIISDNFAGGIIGSKSSAWVGLDCDVKLVRQLIVGSISEQEGYLEGYDGTLRLDPVIGDWFKNNDFTGDAFENVKYCNGVCEYKYSCEKFPAGAVESISANSIGNAISSWTAWREIDGGFFPTDVMPQDLQDILKTKYEEALKYCEENMDEPEEKPSEEPEKPGEEPEKPGEEPEKPGEEPEKPSEEPEKPGKEPEKPGEETEKPGEVSEVTINITLKDKTGYKTAKVVFKPSGASEQEFYSISANEKSVKLNKLTKTGYTFKGWYLEGKKLSSFNAKKLKDGMVLEARFTPNTYVIAYKVTKPDKGIKVEGKINLAKDEKKISYEKNSFLVKGSELKADGYILEGFTTVKDGEVAMIKVGDLAKLKDVIPLKGKKITLYTVWKKL